MIFSRYVFFRQEVTFFFPKCIQCGSFFLISTENLQNKAESRINNRAFRTDALIMSAALLSSSKIGLYLMVLQLAIGACLLLCWGQLPGIARLKFTMA